MIAGDNTIQTCPNRLFLSFLFMRSLLPLPSCGLTILHEELPHSSTRLDIGSNGDQIIHFITYSLLGSSHAV
jgi:hypothetical protein